MKRFLAILLALTALTFQAGAIKAPRTPFVVRRPDGTSLTLVSHGDEFHHWTSTPDGTVMAQESDGSWKKSVRPVESAASAVRRNFARQLRASAAESSISLGKKRFLVVLIEFDDLSFTIDDPGTAFYNLLNQPGYSENSGTGSVRDFYSDNSCGKFDPTFDVYGPVKLSHKYSYYGRNDSDGSDVKPDEALWEACTLLDDQIDFSTYDIDGDGYVDNVFFYYAGHNEAEGGGSSTIWPHAWALYRYKGIYDGVRVWSYACASEYSGSTGKKMCSIGTFVHEFGHVLGLPDFYDTDYEDHGEAETLGSFSTMDSGCYNNNSRTPPLFNAVERNILGWMDTPDLLMQEGPVSLGSIADNKAWYTPTSNEGEVFIYEVRDGTGWDAPLPAGLLVYHLDRSSNKVGRKTAAQLWEDMYDLNVYGNHPCLYIVPSGGLLWPAEYAVFPGAMKVTSLLPQAWDTSMLPFSLEDIDMGKTSATWNMTVNPARTVKGKVTDSSGAPVAGAGIVARRSGGSGGFQPAPAPNYGTTTGSDGTYTLELSTVNGDGKFLLSAFVPGCTCSSTLLDLSTLTLARCDFVAEPSDTDSGVLAAMGYNLIEAPARPAAGEVFDFKVLAAPGNEPLSVMWYYDGTPASGTSVTLKSGSHTLRAVQAYDGRTEELTLEFTVD